MGGSAFAQKPNSCDTRNVERLSVILLATQKATLRVLKVAHVPLCAHAWVARHLLQGVVLPVINI